MILAVGLCILVVVVVDDFGFGSGFCEFWLWVSWFVVVVVVGVVVVMVGCHGWWLWWLVVIGL